MYAHTGLYHLPFLIVLFMQDMGLAYGIHKGRDRGMITQGSQVKSRPFCAMTFSSRKRTR